MHIESDLKLDFSDVLIRPKRSTLESRRDVDLFREIEMPHSRKKLKYIPVMNANMGTSGTFEVAEALLNNGCLATVHKHYSSQEWERFLMTTRSNIDNLFFPVGMSDTDRPFLFEEINLGKDPHDRIKAIMIDVANGYSQKFINYVSEVREIFPDHIIAAGNVATAEMTEALIIAGADIVKIGIGNGSVCTTRLKAGVGYPQLSAVMECADAAHGMGGHIISDGGCVVVSDFSKAIGAGADIVMSGSFFAGCDESGGEIKQDSNGNPYCINYGMSSRTAQEKFGDGLKDYRSSEGRTAKIPYTGPVDGVIKDILGGIRSTCTYVGAKKIKELPKRTTFVRVNNTHNRTFENTTIGD